MVRIQAHTARMRGDSPDLVEDVLGRATQQDGARLGLLAVDQEGVELVADLEHLKQARTRPDVRVPNLFHPARSAHAHSTGNNRNQQLHLICITLLSPPLSIAHRS